MKLLAGPQPCAGATSQLYGGTSPSPEMTRPVPQGSQWMPSGAPWPHALPLLSIRCVCVCVCVCVFVQIVHPERGCSVHGVGAQGPSEGAC